MSCVQEPFEIPVRHLMDLINLAGVKKQYQPLSQRYILLSLVPLILDIARFYYMANLRVVISE